MERPFERVYTVTDYYDGPRGGVADFGGVPHVYRSLFLDPEDEWDAERFELSPLSPEAFALALEDWAIWQRFERAYRAGEAEAPEAEKDWGALPEDQARCREIRPVLQQALAIDPEKRMIARAEFRVREPIPVDLPLGVMRPLEVRWTPDEQRTVSG